MSRACTDFRPRSPWLGPHLQTIRGRLLGSRVPIRAYRHEVVEFSLRDGSGDRLRAFVDFPHPPARSAAVVLVHGLASDQDGHHVRRTAGYLLHLGFPVMRLALRGVGISRETCGNLYHAGSSDDLNAALRDLCDRYVFAGLALVGYCVGGSIVLKALAEHAGRLPLLAGVAISAPIDLAAAARAFSSWRNRLYAGRLLAQLKRDASSPWQRITSCERRAIERACTIIEFDDTFVAPRNGYRDAEHFYEANSALQVLRAITVPTALICALDDPWIPRASYDSFAWHETPNLFPMLPRNGGHLGFHGAGSRTPWHDLQLAAFLDMFVGAADRERRASLP
jgi:uncharacterized protein